MQCCSPMQANEPLIADGAKLMNLAGGSPAVIGTAPPPVQIAATATPVPPSPPPPVQVIRPLRLVKNIWTYIRLRVCIPLRLQLGVARGTYIQWACCGAIPDIAPYYL